MAYVGAIGALVLAMCLWLVFAPSHAVRADSSTPALDRQLVERMTRALEAQASATQALVRAAERCNR